MTKKIIILIIVLLILGGGFFYWWRWQADVREMNKGLPEGVRVAKSLAGQYKVNNKKDGYVVRVPEAWRGLAKIEYSQNKDGAGFSLEGKEGEVRLIGVGQFKLKEEISLENWTQQWRQKFKNLDWIREEEKMKDFEIIKLKEEKHLAGMIFYFFKTDSKIYEVSGMSEEFIREIILKSEW